jgi:hypothetical protein
MTTPLLNIDKNPKTVKGRGLGFMTAILYLIPWKFGGVNLCPMAHIAGCIDGCLGTAGHGGIAKKGDIIATDAGPLPNNVVQRGRMKRTKLFNTDRDAFMAQLVAEILAFEKKAMRKGLTPVVRLNGTSDIDWLRIPVSYDHPTDGVTKHANIFALFSHIQFYDYTKVAKRMRKARPDNYHLTLSYSEATKRYTNIVRAEMEKGASIVMVVRDAAARDQRVADGAIDGDAHDLRFLDPAGSVTVLKAKGRARRDVSGFVID